MIPLLQQAVEYSAARGISLAIESHIDFSAPELVELVKAVNHPNIGVCLDTANNLRMFDDASEVIEMLAPHALTVHLKDIVAYKGSPRNFGFWPSATTGSGLVDIPFAIECLEKAGYTGLLAIEFDYLHPQYKNVDEVLVESIAYMRGLLGR